MKRERVVNVMREAFYHIVPGKNTSMFARSLDECTGLLVLGERVAAAADNDRNVLSGRDFNDEGRDRGTHHVSDHGVSPICIQFWDTNPATASFAASRSSDLSQTFRHAEVQHEHGALGPIAR